MKIAFYTKNMKRESLEIFIKKIYILRVIEEYASLKKYSTTTRNS